MGNRARALRCFLVATALIAVVAVAATAGYASSTAAATPAATSPTTKQCIAAARAATAAVKKRLTIPQYPAFNMAANKGKNVWFIAPSLSTGYALVVSQGVKAAADAAGVKLTVWDSRGLASEMAAGLDRAIADKADAIVIHAISPTLVATQLKEAADAKIPVLSILNGLSPKSLPTGITATLDPDAAKLGALQADYALSQGNCKVNAGWFYAPSFPIQVDMTNGLQAEFKRLCPACGVKLQTFDLPTMATNLPQQTANFIQSNPDVNYLVAAFDTAATFMIQGVRTVGKKVWLVGANGNAPNLDILRQGGPQIADVAYPPGELLGWDVIDQVGRMLQGQASAKQRSIPVQAIDFTNVGKGDDVASVFPKLVGFENAYKKMWRLG
jgi:ABC-type sugar transport system substrate-binding protein